MRRHWVTRGIKFLLLAVVGVVVLSYVVMRLWNFAVPPLTGWHTLGFGQALALLVLCRILFGGFRGRGGFRPGHRLRGRWQQLSPEEREKLREKMQSRCGFGPAERGSATPGGS